MHSNELMGVRTWWKATGATSQLSIMFIPSLYQPEERERISDLRKSSLLLASVLHTRHACGTGTLQITQRDQETAHRTIRSHTK